MRFNLFDRTAALLLGLLAADSLYAQTVDKEIPVTNWTVPAYAGRPATAPGELRALADISPGIAFVAITPCRFVDTRLAPGPYGGPKFGAGEGRDYNLTVHPTCTGIPIGVDAYSLNFTVTQTNGDGFLAVYPTGTPFPGVSTINYIGVNHTIANAAIVPAGTGGSVHVDAGVNGTHVVIDINGYLTNQYNPNRSFEAIGTSNTQLGLFQNNSTANNTHGVTGQSLSTGILGSVGLSAGVRGIEGSGLPAIPPLPTIEPTSGVLGLSKNWIGVFGLSEKTGVEGHIHGSDASALATGRLGHVEGANVYALHTEGNVLVQGTFTATGVKSFVEPHPHDASKQIQYIAVEAPSADIYFRGTAQISQGITKIEVPEHFRLVARPGSYATMVTPIGAMATVAVLSENENGIVVRASRNVKIHYVVYAERNSFRDHNPIVQNIHFRPDASGDMGPGFPESYREILIRNGTLNPDGTLNLETAKRLGWEIKELRAHGGEQARKKQ